MDEHGTNAVNTNMKPTPKPELTAEGVTIYPTSFLPTKSKMEPSRVPQAKMQGIHIEAIHVVIFFLLLYVLFAPIWKKSH